MPATLEPARDWVRVHLKSRRAIFFSLTPTHRYSHPDCPHRIVYMAMDEETCLWERFGDHVFDHAHTVPRTHWEDGAFSRIHVPKLRVCDLSQTKTRGALSVDLAALMHPDISVPQEWGLAIQRHPSQVAAINFRSRFTNKACLAIFDRPGAAAMLKERSLGPLSISNEALDWLTTHGIVLV